MVTRELALMACLALVGCVSTRQSPDLTFEDYLAYLHNAPVAFFPVREVDYKTVEENFDTLHPWEKGSALPANFADAGLESPVTLVNTDIYLDGGSMHYVFRGANGKFFVVCTDAPTWNHSKPGKNSVPYVPQLFVGGGYWTDPQCVPVPRGSPCERFLIGAIKSEVERIIASDEGQRLLQSFLEKEFNR